MMFDRLLGLIANRNANIVSWRDPKSDVRLAAAILLFSVGTADYENLPEESAALFNELQQLFGIGNKRTRKLISRAAAAKNTEPTIFASAAILNRKTSEEFRRLLVVAMQRIAMVDNVLHPQELDLTIRAKRLLCLDSVALN